MNQRMFADERFFHLIVQASPAGMLIADDAGKIILANAQAEKIFDYPSGTLLGKTVESLIPAAHAREHASHRARYAARPEPRSMAKGRDLFGQRRDGSQVPVDISLHPIENDGRTYVLANILEATERRRLARQQESKQAMERLALLGQLAGGVAHEIRTPLCVIRNNIYYLKIIADKLDEEATECVQEIDQAIGKAERIVSELLDYTRDGPVEQTVVDASELIRHSLAILEVSPRVTIESSAQTRRLVRGDPEQIERILINLIRNAIEAIGEDGMVQLRAGDDDGVVWIEVADDGPGISPSEKERVFEPLFTTKHTGIGLGLAVSKRYAERNGGTLTVGDNTPRGACFRLTLAEASSEAE